MSNVFVNEHWVVTKPIFANNSLEIDEIANQFRIAYRNNKSFPYIKIASLTDSETHVKALQKLKGNQERPYKVDLHKWNNFAANKFIDFMVPIEYSTKYDCKHCGQTISGLIKYCRHQVASHKDVSVQHPFWSVETTSN